MGKLTEKKVPTIAVLLATFNGEKYLNEQLMSIKKQSNVSVTLMISDDCSSDDTLLLLNKARVDVPHFLLPNKKLGSASANFFRLICDSDFSHVDYVALSDQDDIWLSNKLSHAVKEILENDVDAYSSNVTAFWPNSRKKLIHKAQSLQQWDYIFESAGPGCTFVLTQKLALALQDFLITNQEACCHIALHDWFIYAFTRSRGYNWFIDKESHMLYRQHSGNVVGANVGIKAWLARWQKLRKGWLIEQALLLADILGYKSVWPVKKLQHYLFTDRFLLILNIKKFRRRLRDRIALTLFLLLPLKK